MEELAKQLGYDTAPFGYAALAYGLFHWLDENVSDEMKAVLARTMRFKDYKDDQIASALVEVFDWIYTYPLLRWRAFFRSLLFTTVVSAIFLFEVIRPAVGSGCPQCPLWQAFFLLLFNVFSDYLSLFAIRPLLIRSGTKPVIGLALGAVSGAAIVLAAHLLRTLYFMFSYYATHHDVVWRPTFAELMLSAFTFPGLFFALPALAVFAWLPLFALGILVARLLTPLSWVVGNTQWALKEGKEHPLKAIGYVAAVVVFIGTVAARVVFGA
jgi:hypothetical protein